MQGFGVYRNYFKAAIDKLKIDWNVFRVGTHKSAVEPYIRDDMSDEYRAEMTRLLDELWAMYRQDVRDARELGDGTVQYVSENLSELIGDAEGAIGNIYVDAGFIDGLVDRTELQQRVLQYVDEDADREGYYDATSLDSYLADQRLLNGDTTSSAGNVGIVVASGQIVNGSQPPGTIGGDSTAALLRRALTDDNVDAVVLRVDSPGGGIFASRIIGDEVIALREAGKPVVVSMSSVAASGGYWISMAADKIFASPATITGSIGVFGMIPTFERALDHLGVSTDGVGTTPWSGQFRPDRSLSDDAVQLVRSVIEHDYDDFISRVSTSRELEVDFVDSIAQGQVWTGEEAVANGLVDELGTLDDAIEAAAAIAELDDYGYKYIEKRTESHRAAGRRVAVERRRATRYCQAQAARHIGDRPRQAHA